MKKYGLILLAVFVTVCGFIAYPQDDLFSDERRAGYIFDFIRQITWPKDKSITVLKIGIPEDASNLGDEIIRQAVGSNKLRGKSVEVIRLSSFSNLPDLQILYIDIDQHPETNVNGLMSDLRKKGTLLITEAGVFKQSMINFVAKKGKTYYEVNEEALQKEGFKYMDILTFSAIKTKEDWETLFKETKQELDEEKIITARQRQEIEEQEKEIAKNTEEIAGMTVKITGMTEEIERQQERIDRQRNRLTTLRADITAKQKELKQQEKEIEQQELQITEKQQEIEEQSRINTLYGEEINTKQSQIGNLNTQINQQLAKLKMQNVIMIMGGLLVVFLAGFGIYIYRNYKQKQRVNRILEQQNIEITEQRDRIARQNKEITDSIIYAQRIQKAILPKRSTMQGVLEMYIFYRPRDIVSGDFYWMTQKNDQLIIIAADCTGHGVPGAFMSMLGVAFLNEIIGKGEKMYANEILNELREYVIRSLHQTGISDEDRTRDGMDIALCIVDYPSMTLQYAGAYNPLILIRNNELQEVKADKMPVAYSDYHGNMAFTNNLVPVIPGDCVYMFSDGYADQFGGNDEKKFSSKRLKASLLEVSNLPMNEQEQVMAEKYDNWKGNHKQIDDVLLVGIRI